MARSRKHPPLFEVLGSDRSTDRPTSPGRPTPVVVANRPTPAREAPPEQELPEPKPVVESSPEPLEPWESARVYRIPANVLYLSIACVFILLVGVWSLGHKFGQAYETAKLGERIQHVEKQNADLLTPQRPITPPARSGMTDPAPVSVTPPTPAPEPAPEVWSDPREVGTNYLLVSRSPWRDASAAGRFLTDNGIPAAVVPVRSSIDLEEAEAKNAMCYVIALEGYPSGQFQSSIAERKALERKVESIGRTWKLRGGSDNFQSRYWERFDG